MIKYPLFGKDSKPDISSSFFASIGTVIFLIIFIICLIVIKPVEKKKVYKEVQIHLDNSPIEKVMKEDPKKEKKEIPPVIEKVPPVEEESIIKEEVKPKEESKTVTPKKEVPKPKPAQKPKPKAEKQKTEVKENINTVPKQEVKEPTYALDMDDLWNNQINSNQNKKNADDFDWDAMFGDDSTTIKSSSNTGKVTTKNTIEGSAGQVASNKNKNHKTTSEAYKSEGDMSVSDDLMDILNNVKDTTYKSTDNTGTTTETTIKTTTDNGSVVIKMDDGRPRHLLKPATPQITLSKEAISKIDGSKSVTITIKVLGIGAVQDVRITPEATLPMIVREEIVKQIKKWQFDSAEYDATAHFEYNIVKK